MIFEFLIPEFCTQYRSEAQKALCLKRSWSNFDPQAYTLYGEDQNHETSFKGKALQAVVGTWCKLQVIVYSFFSLRSRSTSIIFCFILSSSGCVSDRALW